MLRRRRNERRVADVGGELRRTASTYAPAPDGRRMTSRARIGLDAMSHRFGRRRPRNRSLLGADGRAIGAAQTIRAAGTSKAGPAGPRTPCCRTAGILQRRDLGPRHSLRACDLSRRSLAAEPRGSQAPSVCPDRGARGSSATASPDGALAVAGWNGAERRAASTVVRRRTLVAPTRRRVRASSATARSGRKDRRGVRGCDGIAARGERVVVGQKLCPCAEPSVGQPRVAAAPRTALRPARWSRSGSCAR